MRICSIKQLVGDNAQSKSRAWGLKGKWLKQNEVITYCHGEGVTAQHIQEWEVVFREVEGFTNLTFKAQDDWKTALLRISYVEGGSWSYKGSDNYYVSKSEATTNIGWYGAGTKRHELGHFVGLGHEHQNPRNKINLNHEAVYKFYQGPPNYWTRAQTYWNVIKNYEEKDTEGTELDSESNMLYPIPAEFTTDGFSSTYNEFYSKKDKEFLASIYPKKEEEKEVEIPETKQVIGLFIKDYMSNDPRQLRKLRATSLKAIAKELEISYKNKRTTSEEIVAKLKQ